MGLNKHSGIMVIPFEVVDHQDLSFNVPYISSKATHKLPNILRKKSFQKIDPIRVIAIFLFLQYHPLELPLGG
jgi:hypothetical protein